MEADLNSEGDEYRRLSLWWDSLPGAIERRSPLPGDIDVDVAIVGGGFTALWTAYYLAKADPSLKVAIVERDIVGFGASGRNGGWCSALFAASEEKLNRVAGPGAGQRMRQAMQQTVDEVGAIAHAEGIDCAFAKGGTVTVARTPAQLARTQHEVAAARRTGISEEDLRLLSADEARAMVGTTSILGGTFTPHCAVVDPARLVRGLAQAVERQGVTIYEQSAVSAIESGTVHTTWGTIRAGVVVRATEGYTASLPGEKRTLVPVYSLMIATEPLPESFWQQTGLAQRQTFADHRHLIIYGQRTGDNRLAFGGRGAPYHFGSTIQPAFDCDSKVHQALRVTLVELFPALNDVVITHTWGGPLGIARDWFPSVGIDRSAKLAWAGGYVGDGVSTSNLAGRTLTDLILERDSELTGLPWVGHQWKKWEPEPLRYLGINAGLLLSDRADAAEDKAGKQTWHARALGRLTGD